jgi:hypothetical protein
VTSLSERRGRYVNASAALLRSVDVYDVCVSSFTPRPASWRRSFPCLDCSHKVTPFSITVTPCVRRRTLPMQRDISCPSCLTCPGLSFKQWEEAPNQYDGENVLHTHKINPSRCMYTRIIVGVAHVLGPYESPDYKFWLSVETIENAGSRGNLFDARYTPQCLIEPSFRS